MIVKTDCTFYQGSIPCYPHKKYGYHCKDCTDYKKISKKILVLKLGALGDVIRTTPIIRRLRELFPNAQITWLTYFPKVLSTDWVDQILEVNIENLTLLKNIEFDWLINLDKDPLAISLTKEITAIKKNGFTIDEWGRAISISNKAEEHKWITGIFDDVNKKNNKHYVLEIFEICNFKFSDEEYILDISDNNVTWDISKDKRVIGLNTGCGGRWSSRLWSKENWIDLSKGLLKQNYEVILLGGKDEHKKNEEIRKSTGAKYFGYFPIDVFINLLNNCDLIVTSVTMAMHLAIGLKKQLILFNNIFNKSEFYLYNRGRILEPEFDCDCYYSPTCKNNCMQYLYPETVLRVVKELTKV